MSGKKGMTRITRAEMTEIVRMRIEGDMPWPAVACAMNRSIAAMRMAVGKVERPGWYNSRPITDREIALGRALYRSGMSWASAAAIVGRSANTLKKRCACGRSASEAARLRWQKEGGRISTVSTALTIPLGTTGL